MLRKVMLLICLLILSGCQSLGFSGIDLETAMGTEQGIDQGMPTNKGVYSELFRLRFDVKK